MCLWPFVVSSLPKEAVHALTTRWGVGGGVEAPLPAPPPGAAENLSTSFFVTKYFACVSFTLVLQFLPTRQVSCSFHPRLCVCVSGRPVAAAPIEGCGGLALVSPAGEVAFRVSFIPVSHLLTGFGGVGGAGNYSNISRCWGGRAAADTGTGHPPFPAGPGAPLRRRGRGSSFLSDIHVDGCLYATPGVCSLHPQGAVGRVCLHPRFFSRPYTPPSAPTSPPPQVGVLSRVLWSSCLTEGGPARVERAAGDSRGHDRCGWLPSRAGLSVGKGAGRNWFSLEKPPARAQQLLPGGASCKRPSL